MIRIRIMPVSLLRIVKWYQQLQSVAVEARKLVPV